MRRRITFRSLLLLAAVALVALTVVSACGGDDKDKGKSNRTPTIDLATPPPVTTTPRVPSGGTPDGSGSQPTEAAGSQQDTSAERTADAASKATDEADQVAEQATEDAQDAAADATDEAQDGDGGDG